MATSKTIKEKIASYLRDKYKYNSVGDSNGIGIPQSYVEELIHRLEQNPAAFEKYLDNEYEYLSKKIQISSKKPREYGFHKEYVFKLQRDLIENLFFQLHLLGDN
jgi:hypothetical protein